MAKINVTREIHAFEAALAEWYLISVTGARWAVRTKPDAERFNVERQVGIVRERHGIARVNNAVEIETKYGSRPAMRDLAKTPSFFRGIWK
jgi:hypothetical protein